MIHSWLVLFPPVIILVAALISKRLNPSIILGLISAALVAQHFMIMPAINLLITRLFKQVTDPENIYLYGFLIILGILISLLEYIGAALAFAHRLITRLKTAKSAQTATMVISSILFIDDYLSCLTSGYVMRPLFDRFRLPRVKLAYLIHSLSAPLVILAPISSWIALITSQLENAGISPLANHTTRIIADPFYIYLQSIPYIFYSIILIMSVWLVVRRSLSFGQMHEQEVIADTTGNLFGGKEPLTGTTTAQKTTSGSVWELVFPLFLLIVIFISGIAWAGGYWLFGGSYSFVYALQKNNQTALMLFLASIITLSVTFLINLMNNKINGTVFLKKIVPNGIAMMQSSIIMVFLASTFGIMLREDLQTGIYLAQVLQGAISIALLPFLFYLISIIAAFITGSAWGTIALMIPIATQMITTLSAVPLPASPADISILFPALGAIFSGAVCGNHISPIAETTIMSANSAGCYPIDHAITQFWYALPAVIGAGISFIVCGFLISAAPLFSIGVSLGVGLIFSLATLALANRFGK